MFKINPLRKRQFYGILIGVLLAITATVCLLFIKPTEKYLSIGPMNTGHEDFSCNTCHVDAKGTWIQQIQSNTAHAVGLRKKMADFGSLDIDTKKCISCHDRDNDRHAPHRFLEPKYKKAVKIIDGKCTSCHVEHNGVRMSMADGNFCIHCHKDTKFKDDPLDTPHSELFKKGMWSTCLQCHDFHGNHQQHPATVMKDTIPLKLIKDYFDGGDDPYQGVKRYDPLPEEDWIKKYAKK